MASRYTQTPAEIVDARDVEAAAQTVAAAAGLGRLKAATALVSVPPPPVIFADAPPPRGPGPRLWRLHA